jgi:predicted NBD/HSP70 family sugar kinase
MSIGRGMITSLVDELLVEEAIYEGATVDAPRGRKPKMLYVRTRDRLVVGVDVRFSRTYVMLGDFGGTPVATESFDTLFDPAALVDALVTRIRRLVREHGGVGRCEGVGLVVPGMVDQRSGRVLNSPQLGWREVEVRDALARASDLPVEIENAPIACALAQMWFSDPGVKVPRNYVYVTVSDGVGAGIVANGELVRGDSNTAGEFGHIPIDLDGPVCLCGAKGCLEAHTSNIATISRYIGVPFSPGAARDLLHTSGITISDVVSRAQSGDTRACDAIVETARFLGAGIAGIVNALNPGTIFIGGEIMGAWEIVGPEIRRAVAQRALSDDAANTRLVVDSADSYPRLRGATALVAAKGFAAPSIA